MSCVAKFDPPFLNSITDVNCRYGHYAAMGLDIRPYTKGLDSNCVRGGKLSAYVMSSKHEQVVSVRCRAYLTD